MLAHLRSISISVIAAVTLLASHSLAIDCAPDFINHRPVRRDECSKAISQIVYNSDNTLDKTSKRIDYTFGECSISLYNDLGADITKEQVQYQFNTILDQCHNESGGNTTTSHDASPVSFYIGNRAIDDYLPWESDFPPRVPTCEVRDPTHLTQSDCMKAFSDIVTDTQGRFLTDEHEQTDSVEKTYKSCTVNIYTYDFSKLNVKKQDVEDDFGKTLHFCNSQCGVIRIRGGAEGPNGRVYLSFRRSNTDGCMITRKPLLTA
ncbi:hypothetical protein Pst134EA_013220 [Puccinia striiformis f. sp. tritici]|uniref:hypothetical protein n=1 Tax=Puccinia striiformis f. sp. tritici TaxID=168172 RepID=UPI0020079160|nr:hypothetical protein Pst134EA_013220 [Puccinia striiformis f. sp. tritici]KAH9465331.1 hypothetical protein Pst134EA_013220 [Puccinia striiformis f. sp. tritici]KAI9630683.1 hypothetical protein KEM48_013711 [Puccinia striiformis f. sp. tritici PST-130]